MFGYQEEEEGALTGIIAAPGRPLSCLDVSYFHAFMHACCSAAHKSNYYNTASRLVNTKAEKRGGEKRTASLQLLFT